MYLTHRCDFGRTASISFCKHPRSSTTGFDHGSEQSQYEGSWICNDWSYRWRCECLIISTLHLTDLIRSQISYSSMRIIGERVHPLIAVNCYAVSCFLASTLAVVFLPGVAYVTAMNQYQWACLLFMGGCGSAMVSTTTSTNPPAKFNPG